MTITHDDLGLLSLWIYEKLVLSKRAVCILLECFLANNISYLFVTVRNEVAKVMFLHVSVCPQGGSTWAGTPLTRYTPTTPSGTRYNPRDQVYPPDQVHPPPSETRYTPLGPGTPPGTSTTQGDGYCCGRYASYGNTFLFTNVFTSLGKIWRIENRDENEKRYVIEFSNF